MRNNLLFNLCSLSRYVTFKIFILTTEDRCGQNIIGLLTYMIILCLLEGEEISDKRDENELYDPMADENEFKLKDQIPAHKINSEISVQSLQQPALQPKRENIVTPHERKVNETSCENQDCNFWIRRTGV